ncbi:MAG: dipeptidase [Chloroflexi bacterium]|nr:dipeptidase [Chloroflexota bacterium]
MSNLDQSESSSLQRARELHRQGQFIDGHNDLPYAFRNKAEGLLSRFDLGQHQPELHTDIARLREGGVGGQFWVAYAPAWLPEGEYVQRTMDEIDFIHNMIRRYPETFELALTADDAGRAFQAGKIASLIGVEGGHSIVDSLGVLRTYYRLGVRYMTMTHFDNTNWADSATDTPVANGLTEFGREVVREMNRLGMLVDLSHVSPETMHDTLNEAEAPVIFSHSSARGLTDHSRNVPDDVLTRLPENGGVVMVAFPNAFINKEACDHWYRRDTERKRLEALPGSTEEAVDQEIAGWEEANPAPPGTLTEVADHIDHIRDRIGVDYIGIGSDFDGMSDTPDGLEDVSKYPMLTAELVRREYSDEDILKIMGRNVLRALRGAEAVAQRLQQERGPSEARIEDLDGPPPAGR